MTVYAMTLEHSAYGRDSLSARMARIIRTTRLFEAAGGHFNRGQRAFSSRSAISAGSFSPWVLFVTTAMVVVVIWRRQFASNAWRAMAS